MLQLAQTHPQKNVKQPIWNFSESMKHTNNSKARQGEETFEIIVMGNGRVEKQYYTTSEEKRKSDPDRVNFERIVEIRENFPNVKRKNWSDGKYKHPPGGRHNGDFGPIRR